MSRRKARVQPKRTADRQTARKEVETLKTGIATAVKLLRRMEDDLDSIGAFVYVCVEALRAPRGDEVSEDAAKVLDAAYVKLVEHVGDDVRNALTALGKEGAP